ncbi:MAG: MFS transporter [Frankia sp.]
MLIALSLATADQTIVTVALPTIAGQFGGDVLTWLVSAYILPFAISAPLFGKLGDLFGRRNVLQVSIVVLLVGSALCGVAQSAYQLIGLRVVQGIGAGGVVSASLGVTGEIIPPRERGRYTAYFATVSTASTLLGPLLGGVLVDRLSWRSVFYVNLPVGLAALALVYRTVPAPAPARRASIDWPGAGWFVAAAGVLLTTIQTGGRSFPWRSWQTVALLSGAAILFAAFVRREHTAPEAVLPPRLFTNRTFRVCAVLSFVTGMVVFSTTVFLQQYFQLVDDVSATVGGLRMLPFLGGVLLASVLSSRRIRGHGRYKRHIVSGTVAVTAGLLLLTRIGAGTGAGPLAVWMFTTGAGLGLFMQNQLVAAQNAADRRDIGVTTSTILFLQSVGGLLSVSALGALLSARTNTKIDHLLPGGVAVADGSSRFVEAPRSVARLPEPARRALRVAYADSLSLVFAVLVVIGLLAVVASIFLREIRLSGPSGISQDGRPGSPGAPRVSGRHRGDRTVRHRSGIAEIRPAGSRPDLP